MLGLLRGWWSWMGLIGRSIDKRDEWMFEDTLMNILYMILGIWHEQPYSDARGFHIFFWSRSMRGFRAEVLHRCKHAHIPSQRRNLENMLQATVGYFGQSNQNTNRYRKREQLCNRPLIPGITHRVCVMLLTCYTDSGNALGLALGLALACSRDERW